MCATCHKEIDREFPNAATRIACTDCHRDDQIPEFRGKIRGGVSIFLSYADPEGGDNLAFGMDILEHAFKVVGLRMVPDMPDAGWVMEVKVEWSKADAAGIHKRSGIGCVMRSKVTASVRMKGEGETREIMAEGTGIGSSSEDAKASALRPVMRRIGNLTMSHVASK